MDVVLSSATLPGVLGLRHFSDKRHSLVYMTSENVGLKILDTFHDMYLASHLLCCAQDPIHLIEDKFSSVRLYIYIYIYILCIYIYIYMRTTTRISAHEKYPCIPLYTAGQICETKSYDTRLLSSG
jgi:hypothetical protein